MYMKISNRRLRKIRKMKNQTRKRNKSHKRRKKKGGEKRSFRRKNYVNLRRQTLKRQRGGGTTAKETESQLQKNKVRLKGLIKKTAAAREKAVRTGREGDKKTHRQLLNNTKNARFLVKTNMQLLVQQKALEKVKAGGLEERKQRRRQQQHAASSKSSSSRSSSSAVAARQAAAKKVLGSPPHRG